jgi:hypothetical protein
MSDTAISSDNELLALSFEQLKERARVCSFDSDKLTDRLRTGERWHQLIQGHLYIDHVIVNMLTEALEKPASIRLSRLGFQQKLELVEALALLPTELVSIASLVNKLRNRIAHSLEFQVSESDVIDLRNCVPSRMREALQADAKENPEKSMVDDVGNPTFGGLLLVTVLQIEVVRQEKALARLEARKNRAALSHAVKSFNETLNELKARAKT